MRAVLEFILPEEAEEHLDALNGGKWKYVVSEMDNKLRSAVKYGDKKADAEELRTYLRELVLDHGLSLE